jgi:hypothetical protein
MTLDFRVAAYWGDRCFDLAHSIQHFSYGFFKNWFYAFSIDWHIHYPPINKIAFWRLCCIQVEMGRKKKRLLPADGRWWSPLAFRHIFYHAPLLFTWSCVCVCARLEENDLVFFNSCHSCSALTFSAWFRVGMVSKQFSFLLARWIFRAYIFPLFI